MRDMIADGLAWLDGQRLAHMSRNVLYIADGTPREIAATIARTDFTVEDSDGTQTGGTIVDFIVAADALPLDPKPGDRIMVGAAAYEVAQFGSDSSGWRWTSGHREARRIHTVEVPA